jgi:hypothetical protein
MATNGNTFQRLVHAGFARPQLPDELRVGAGLFGLRALAGPKRRELGQRHVECRRDGCRRLDAALVEGWMQSVDEGQAVSHDPHSPSLVTRGYPGLTEREVRL